MYWLLKHGAEYVRQSVEAYEAAYQERVLKGLARRAAALGYRLEPSARMISLEKRGLAGMPETPQTLVGKAENAKRREAFAPGVLC